MNLKIIDNYKHFDLNFSWLKNMKPRPYKKIINIIDKRGTLCFEMHDNSKKQMV